MKAAFNNPERAMDFLLNVEWSVLNLIFSQGMPTEPQIPP